MDVILILAITLVIIFIGALFYLKTRQSGNEQNNNREAPAAPRRLGPANDDRPRAAQVRNRRRFNPARELDEPQEIMNDDGR